MYITVHYLESSWYELPTAMQQVDCIELQLVFSLTFQQVYSIVTFVYTTMFITSLIWQNSSLLTTDPLSLKLLDGGPKILTQILIICSMITFICFDFMIDAAENLLAWFIRCTINTFSK